MRSQPAMIPCRVCQAGHLEPKTIFWLDGPPMMAGFALLGIGVLVAVSGLILSVSFKESNSGIMVYSSVPALVFGIILTARRRVLCCDRCQAIVPTA